MEVVRELVPSNIRLGLYAAYVIAGVILGSISTAAAALGTEMVWLPAAESVMAYLAVPLMVLAGVNVPDSDEMTYDPRH